MSSNRAEALVAEMRMVESKGGPQRQDPGASRDTEVPPLTAGSASAASSLVPRPYSPLDTVLPRLWIPWVAATAESGTLGGFVTGGQDVLQRHRWLLSALYGPESGRFMHTLAYDYDGLRPTLSLLSADVDRTYADLVPTPAGYRDYTERERIAGLEAALAVPGFEASQALSLGYRYRHLTARSPSPAVPPPPDEEPATGSLGAFRLGWAYSSARRQTFSISPEGGRTLRLALEHAQEGFGSGRTFTRASADWSEYLPLPARRHVLLARLFGGTSGGETPAQGAYALGGEPVGDVALSVDDEALPLRGYPLNALRGDNAVLLGLEYRFPLREIGRGGDTAPFFLRRLHGALFVDAGEAWDGGGFSAGGLRTGVGAELRLDLTFSYFLPLTLHLGVAWGLDEEGGIYPTLGLTAPPGLPGAATPTGRR